jgi:hypothetical protein
MQAVEGVDVCVDKGWVVTGFDIQKLPLVCHADSTLKVIHHKIWLFE